MGGLDHAGHHCDLHGDTHTGYRHITVFRHLAVHEDAGKAHQKVSQCGGDTDGKNTGGNLFLHREILEVNAQRGCPFQKVTDVLSYAHHIPDDGGNGCTGNVPAEHEDHNGVKNDIQEIFQKLTHHRLAGLSLGADDIGVVSSNYNSTLSFCFERNPPCSAGIHFIFSAALAKS